MATLKVFHSDHEILGQMISDFTGAIGSDQFHSLIEKYGYRKVDPKQWYSLQQFLDFTEDLRKQSGGRLNLVSIGISMAMNGVFPPDLDQMPILEILKLIPLSYPLNNRGTNIGYVKAEILTAMHVKFMIKNPYSEDMIYGTTYGIMKRFATPQKLSFTVYYDENVPRREEGGEETIIHIEWREKYNHRADFYFK